MLLLYHHSFSVPCRFVRLILSEYEAQFKLSSQNPWNVSFEGAARAPGHPLPTLVENQKIFLYGYAIIMEYVDETRGYLSGERRLLPDSPDKRAEVRRLVSFFLDRMNQEVTALLLHERVYKKEIPHASGGGAPCSNVLRQARTHILPYLKKLDALTDTQHWITGNCLSFADFSVGAILSCADYFGEIPWDQYESLKMWYARIKSRPSFRPLLNERIVGIPPAPSYSDLDF